MSRHRLKLEFSPAAEPRREWQNPVRMARDDLVNRITTTIVSTLGDDVDHRYVIARRPTQADLAQHPEGKAALRLPRRCPCTLAQIHAANGWPERADVSA